MTLQKQIFLMLLNVLLIFNIFPLENVFFFFCLSYTKSEKEFLTITKYKYLLQNKEKPQHTPKTLTHINTHSVTQEKK